MSLYAAVSTVPPPASQMMKLCDARSLRRLERVEAWMAAASGSLRG